MASKRTAYTVPFSAFIFLFFVMSELSHCGIDLQKKWAIIQHRLTFCFFEYQGVMKKTVYTVCMSVLLGLPLAAQDAVPTPSELTAESRSYLEISRAILQVLRDLTGTLDAVQNKSAADASAQKVIDIAERMQQLQAQADSIPALTLEQEAEVKANINETEVRETVHNFLVSVVQMSQVNCYESEALNNALSVMLGKHVKQVAN